MDVAEEQSLLQLPPNPRKMLRLQVKKSISLMNTMINTKIELGTGEKKIKLKRKETKVVSKT